MREGWAGFWGRNDPDNGTNPQIPGPPDEVIRPNQTNTLLCTLQKQFPGHVKQQTAHLLIISMVKEVAETMDKDP